MNLNILLVQLTFLVTCYIFPTFCILFSFYFVSSVVFLSLKLYGNNLCISSMLIFLNLYPTRKKSPITVCNMKVNELIVRSLFHKWKWAAFPISYNTYTFLFFLYYNNFLSPFPSLLQCGVAAIQSRLTILSDKADYNPFIGPPCDPLGEDNPGVSEPVILSTGWSETLCWWDGK